MIIVIYGPPGSGKTTNAEYLKGKYGCKRIVDEYDPIHTSLQDGDLVLTQIDTGWTSNVRVIHIAEALRR